jgi:hypothetical protein
MPQVQLNMPIIIDDFLNENQLKSLQDLASRMFKNKKIGTMRSIYDNPIIDQSYKHNQVLVPLESSLKQTTNTLKRQLISATKGKVKLPVRFELGDPQISYYSKGEYYAPHKDRTEFGLTFLLFLGKKNFKGGDFGFSDLPSLVIPFKENTAILFPSRLTHEVQKVQSRGCRITLQYFLTSNKNKKKSQMLIARERKKLAQDILALVKKNDLKVNDLLAIKARVQHYRITSFVGAYRYLYYSLYGKLPGRLKSSFKVHPELIFDLEASKLKMSIVVMRNKVWTKIIYKNRESIFPFHILIGDILKQLSHKE